MKAQKPGKAHEKMTRFAGRWEGGEIMHPSPWMPEKAESKGTYVCKSELDGFAMVLQYRQTMKKAPGHRAIGMLTWDPERKQYALNWFSNGGGGAEPSYGHWKGQKLVLEHRSPIGVHRYSFAFTGTEGLRFLGEVSQDGENWTLWMEGRYQRKS